jgi:hypothetical protein
MPPTRPLILTACSLVFMTSCATLLNRHTQKIHIATDNKITGLQVEQATKLDSTTYLVTRGRQDLTIHFRLDTTEKTLLLRSQNSFAFWFNVNNYFAGMLIDWKNPKRYSYPAFTYLTAKDSVVERHRYPPTPKGKVRFSLSYLPAGGFSLASPVGRFSAYSPLGLETGLDYFYRPDRYVSLSLGVALGFPGGQHGGDFYKTAGLLYANLRNNYNVGSFDLGYGVNISRFHLISNTLANPNHDEGGFGPSLSAQYRISDNFRIGLSFQSDLTNRYQQYISATLCWKLP